ncbi:hypothetical protein [Trinickia sp. EG282A]|uniref:hypothetical protein n=1 Tax=Trinickia sp. EG282A TaxID=3237013 RepID=UPI0034D2D6C2
MTDNFEESMKRHAKEMKAWLIDRALLVLTGLVLAVAAWATIHYLGESYFSVSASVLTVVLLAENWRLHKLLREHSIKSAAGTRVTTTGRRKAIASRSEKPCGRKTATQLRWPRSAMPTAHVQS